MNETQKVLNEFQNAHCGLLSDDYNPVNTFSDFCEYFLTLADTGLAISVAYDPDSSNDIRIKINHEELFNSPEDVIATYLKFACALSDVHKIGMNCFSFSC